MGSGKAYVAMGWTLRSGALDGLGGAFGGWVGGESEVRGGRGLGLEGFGGLGVFVEAGGAVFVLMFVKISGL